MDEECGHELLERDNLSSSCHCCGHVSKSERVLDCQRCAKTIMRDGDPGFEEAWENAPWWSEVPSDPDARILTDEELADIFEEVLKLPTFTIRREGIQWPTGKENE